MEYKQPSKALASGTTALGFVSIRDSPFLTLRRPLRIMKSPHADVAELADAQVSEACDGDIVEVQVLSSAPVLELQKRAQSPISYLGSSTALAFYLEPPPFTRV